jgi:hypothetical protein
MKKLIVLLALLFATTAQAIMLVGFGGGGGITGDLKVPLSTDWDYPGSVALSPKADAGWDYYFGAKSPGAMVKLGGTYFLYYIGGTGPTVSEPIDELADSKLGVATSTDGVTFTKYASNPIIEYTTGSYEHEGVFSVAAVVVSGTVHLYYGVTHHTGTPSANSVDGRIYHRSSTDGYTFGSATLIYSVEGDEYYSLGVTHDGSTYRLYHIGPTGTGVGVLNMISGTSATSLSGNAVIQSETNWSHGGDVNFIGDEIALLHLGKGSGVIQTRIVETNYWSLISDYMESYVFDADRTNQLVYLDRSASKWFMYQFDQTPAGWHNWVIRVYQATATNATLPRIRFDDFAGTGALSASWTQGSANTNSRSSGLLKGDNVGSGCFAYRNDATFPDDQYASVKISSTLPGDYTGEALVWIGASGSGATLNGYRLLTDGTLNGGDHTAVQKVVNGVYTGIWDAPAGTALASGHRIKLSRHNSGASQVLRAWRDNGAGAGWVQIGSDISDATHQSGGAPGFGTYD